MPIERKRPALTNHESRQKPRPIEETVIKARFNAAGLVLETVERIAPLLQSRSIRRADAIWQTCHTLAGDCLKNGGEPEDAYLTVKAYLEREFDGPRASEDVPW